MKLRRRLSRPRYLSSLAVRTSGLPYSRVQSSKVADFSACFGTFAPVLLGSTRARPRSKMRPPLQLLVGNAKKTLPRERPQQKVKFPRQLPRDCTISAGDAGAVPRIDNAKLVQRVENSGLPVPVGGSTLVGGEKSSVKIGPRQDRASQRESGSNCKAQKQDQSRSDKIGYESGRI